MGSTGETNTKLPGENGVSFEQNDAILDGEYSKNLKILPTNDQVKELQTILRDR